MRNDREAAVSGVRKGQKPGLGFQASLGLRASRLAASFRTESS